MTSRAFPPFLFPTLRSLILLFSSRDANFFQNDGTSPLPDYQKLPAVFSLEIFGLRHSSPSFPPSRLTWYFPLSLTNSICLFLLFSFSLSRFHAFELYLGSESGLRARSFWSSLTLDLDTVCEQTLILHRCRFRAGIISIYTDNKEYRDLRQLSKCYCIHLWKILQLLFITIIITRTWDIKLFILKYWQNNKCRTRNAELEISLLLYYNFKDNNYYLIYTYNTQNIWCLSLNNCQNHCF